MCQIFKLFSGTFPISILYFSANGLTAFPWQRHNLQQHLRLMRARLNRLMKKPFSIRFQKSARQLMNLSVFVPIPESILKCCNKMLLPLNPAIKAVISNWAIIFHRCLNRNRLRQISITSTLPASPIPCMYLHNQSLLIGRLTVLPAPEQ